VNNEQYHNSVSKFICIFTEITQKTINLPDVQNSLNNPDEAIKLEEFIKVLPK